MSVVLGGNAVGFSVFALINELVGDQLNEVPLCVSI